MFCILFFQADFHENNKNILDKNIDVDKFFASGAKDQTIFRYVCYYNENEENLKFMLEIWGDHVVNPEYEILKNKYPGIAGSKKHILKEQYQKVKITN